MVAPHTLAVFTLAALALVLVPGPNVLYITARSVAEGRRSGVVSALGVETGTLVHVAVAAVGLSYLIAASEVAFSVVKYTGAAYLIFLGVRTLLARDAGEAEAAAPRGLRRVYMEGLVVNVFNPKVILFFLALLPQFVDRAAGAVPGQIVMLGLVLFALGVLTDMTYALGAGSLGGWLRGRPAFARRQRYVVGVVYLALGVTAALAGPSARRT
ncbi:MAG TPA: LysE family translocator [Streptosporangiaceae bacterium]|jgi:threonine/homoserine/homoserine lactone efflux protein